MRIPRNHQSDYDAIVIGSGLGGLAFAMAYLSFPSLKDPQAQRHTAEIIAPLSYRSLKAHSDEPWRRRGADYQSAKNRMTEALLDLVERRHPGFRDLVEYSELGTPLTFEHFTAAPSGAIYGYPGTPERFTKAWFCPRTPIRNLYLTGSDVALPGLSSDGCGRDRELPSGVVWLSPSYACRAFPLVTVGFCATLSRTIFIFSARHEAV